jgi:hypothetical protein
MASIDSMTFDQPSYAPGDVVSLTVGYTPDSPSVVPATFTATSVITNSGGTQVATSSADFVVNTPQPAGDVVSATDTGNRTWAQASDDGSVAVFSAVA